MTTTVRTRHAMLFGVSPFSLAVPSFSAPRATVSAINLRFIAALRRESFAAAVHRDRQTVTRSMAAGRRLAARRADISCSGVRRISPEWILP